MKANELKNKYLDFFKKKKHAVISSASLIPEHDPTVLFTTAGMHPLVPFLLGQKHPQGKRIVNVQKCIRTGDIDEVGNATHLTFFEMLGNWSFGDYFKKQAIEWSYEFLVDILNLKPDKLYITVFAGDKDAPKDEESADAWKKLGIPSERIFYLPKKDNWWGPAGKTGPCGPCTEMFYDTGKRNCSKDCKPGCNCGKYFEIWNDVFMEYNKTEKGYEKLKQKSVDTGMGVERTAAMMQGKKTVYEIETLAPIVNEIKKHTKLKEFDEKQTKSLRIIADHLRASVFILGDENKIVPSNLDQGYVLRRFIRRAIRHAKLIGINKDFCSDIAKIIIKTHKEWPELKQNKSFILDELKKEEKRFRLTLEKGIKQFGKAAKTINVQMNVMAASVARIAEQINAPMKAMGESMKRLHAPIQIIEEVMRRATAPMEAIDESTKKFHATRRAIAESTRRLHAPMEAMHKIIRKTTFLLYQSYGFPIEMTEELAKEKHIPVDVKEFHKEFKKHQALSRKGAEKRFKGGLADSSAETTRLHTATHLLNEALRIVLKDKKIVQKGSNITPERLRFDFNFPRKLTQEEIKKVEALVNKKIRESLPVKREEMTLEEAKKKGAQAIFEVRYGEKVSVYSIGDFSIEICMGPHVKNTKEIGKFKIKKQESIAAGIRRIKAVLE